MNIQDRMKKAGYEMTLYSGNDWGIHKIGSDETLYHGRRKDVIDYFKLFLEHSDVDVKSNIRLLLTCGLDEDQTFNVISGDFEKTTWNGEPEHFHYVDKEMTQTVATVPNAAGSHRHTIDATNEIVLPAEDGHSHEIITKADKQAFKETYVESYLGVEITDKQMVPQEILRQFVKTHAFIVSLNGVEVTDIMGDDAPYFIIKKFGAIDPTTKSEIYQALKGCKFASDALMDKTTGEAKIFLDMKKISAGQKGRFLSKEYAIRTYIGDEEDADDIDHADTLDEAKKQGMRFLEDIENGKVVINEMEWRRYKGRDGEKDVEEFDEKDILTITKKDGQITEKEM